MRVERTTPSPDGVAMAPWADVHGSTARYGRGSRATVFGLCLQKKFERHATERLQGPCRESPAINVGGLVRDSNQPRCTVARVVRVPSAIAAQGDLIAAAAPCLANKSNTTFQWPCHRAVAWSVPKSADDPRVGGRSRELSWASDQLTPFPKCCVANGPWAETSTAPRNEMGAGLAQTAFGCF